MKRLYQYVVWICWIIICLEITKACRIKISEIKSNVYRFDKLFNEDFIEIAPVDCSDPPNVQNYLLLTIQLYHPNKNGPIVLQYVSLYHQSLRRYQKSKEFHRYFTFGKISNGDKTINHFGVDKDKSDYNWITSEDYKRKITTTFFEKQSSNKLSKNFAFVVLDTGKSSLKNEAVKEIINKMTYMYITRSNILKRNKAVAYIHEQQFVDFILETVVDGIIFGPDTDEWNKHDFGTQLNETLNKNVINFDLRSEQTLSVNECSGRYVLATATPGKDNICNGRVLELIGITSEENTDEEVIEVLSTDSVASSQQTPPASEQDVEVVDVEQEGNIITPSIVPLVAPEATENSLKRPISNDPLQCPVPAKRQKEDNAVLPWYVRTDHWQKTLQYVLNAKLLSQKQAVTIEVHASWMEVVNYDRADKISIRCRICYKYRLSKRLCVSEDGSHENHKKHECSSLTAFARKEGFRDKSTNMVTKATKHADMPSHKLALNEFKEEFQSVLEGERLENDFEKNPTCNLLRLTYEEVKSNVPFTQHTNLVLLLKMNGVNVGHLHKSRWSAKEMALSISNTLHQRFLKLLKDEDCPIALILDASTDSRGRIMLIMYFRIYYSNWPQVYFYKVIQISSEKAESMFNEIKKTFEKDGILELVKSRLAGLGTDGASVNIGNENGLRAKFRTFVGNPLLPSIHCMAHRLELVMEHALGKVVEDFDFNFKQLLTENINGIATYFGTTASKRKGILSETCNTLELKVYQFRRIFDARWMSTQLAATNTIIRMYKCLWETLTTIDDEISDTERQLKAGAEKYLEKIRNANFYSTLAFFQEVFNILKDYSFTYQQEAAVIPGQKTKLEKLKDKINNLKTTDGTQLNNAVALITCQIGSSGALFAAQECKEYLYDDQKRAEDSVILYYNYTDTTSDEWYQFTQFDEDQDVPSLVEYREVFLNALLEKLDHYYTNDGMEKFDIMDPKKTNVQQNQITFPAQSMTSHTTLARAFKINVPDIGNQFENLLRSVFTKVGHTKFQHWTTLSAQYFYSKILEAVDETMEISDDLRTYIFSVLTVPVGSADAERGFSILFHTLDARRMSLKPETTDALLRIRINGPDISEFYCKMYLDEWLVDHVESDSIFHQPRGKGKNQVDNNELFVEPDDPIEQNLAAYYSNEMWKKRFTPFLKSVI